MNIDFDNIKVPQKTGFTSEELDAIELSDKIISEAENNFDESAKQTVPIYQLKADEEARAKLKNHKEQSEYEELVIKVKEWEALLADKTELDDKALAVLLDDRYLFDELKRSHKVLDDTYAYITKETNKWEEHEAMYDALLSNIKDEYDRCEEARQMLSKLM